jgi:DNA-binding NarL/FixJ family response regulator
MTTSARIRILTVDHHPLLLEGLAAIIRNQPDLLLVAQAVNCREAIDQYTKVQPDVTLMDVRLPDITGIDAMIAIRAQFPEARIIMMTTFGDDGEVRVALQAGASSCIRKNMSPREIVNTIRQVFSGRGRTAPATSRASASRFDPVQDETCENQAGVFPTS